MGRTSLAVRGFIREVDGLRGIAILLVILHHFWPRAGWLVEYDNLPHLGWIGVDLFYVISGFLITGILLDTREDEGYYRNYLARRILRVFPLYYLFVITVFIVIPLGQSGSYFETEFVSQSGSPVWYLLYIGNLREAVTGIDPAYVLGPLWSLAIEEQFYLSMPFLVKFASRMTLTRVLWALLLFAPLFRVVTMLLMPDNPQMQYLMTLSRVDVLSMGCLMAVYLRRTDMPTPNRQHVGWVLTALVAVCAVVFSLGGFDRTQWFCRTMGFSLLAFTFSAFLLWTLLYREERATAWLRFRPLCYCGKICYGLYLLQRPAEMILIRLLTRAGIDLDDPTAILNNESLLLTLAKFAFTVLIATASWYLFEKRVLRLKKRFRSSRHPGEIPATPTTT